MAGDAVACDVLVAVVVDRRKRPAVMLEVALSFLRRVVDVQGDERVLRVFLDIFCEGDRLGIAMRSPGGEDLDEDGLASEIGEGNLLPLERRAADVGRQRTIALSAACEVLSGSPRGVLIVLLSWTVTLLAGLCTLGRRSVSLSRRLCGSLRNDGLRIADGAATGNGAEDEDQGERSESPHRRWLDDRSLGFVAPHGSELRGQGLPVLGRS